MKETVAYLAKTVPKSERDMLAVTTAAEMLTYAAECGTAWMFLAHMATPKAIHRHEVRQFDAIIGKAEAEARSLKETAPARAR